MATNERSWGWFRRAIGTLLRGKSERRLREELQNLPPVDPDAVAVQFEGIPLYPGAQLDCVETARARWLASALPRFLLMRVMLRLTSRLLRLEMAGWTRDVLAVYTVEAPAAKVLAWYHKTLKAAGWKYHEDPLAMRKRMRGRQPARFYRRGQLALWVSAREDAGDGRTRLQLTR